MYNLTSPLQLWILLIDLLDVVYVLMRQSQVRAECFLPFQHVVCYLYEVPLRIIVPVQKLLKM